MKIGFLWQCVFPWDVRLEKIMKACAERGHSVCLVSKGKRGLPRFETIGDVQVDRVSVSDNIRPAILGKALLFPVFFNPIWIGQAGRIFRREEVDLIVVRDLPLAWTATSIARRLGKPVVLDMAENYPAALQAYQNKLYKPFLLGNAWLPKQYEKACLRRIDRVLVVTEEQKWRLERLGIDPRKIMLVGNTPERAFFQSTGLDGSTGYARSDDPIELLFVGKLDAHRGTDLLVHATAELAREYPGLRLTLVGDGTQRKRLVEMAHLLGLNGRVAFPGWVKFEKVADYIARSNICLIPHKRSEHTDTTLPNKLFDYMAFSKPVVASDCLPLKRVIEETGCGRTFRSGDLQDLVRALRETIQDPRLNQKGRNGRHAVETRYNWEVDKNSLFEVLESIGARSV